MTFKTLITDAKTFASKFEAEFVKLFKNAPSALAIVGGVLTYAGPLVTTLVTLTAGVPAGSATAAILATIQSDLAVAKAAITSADSSVNVSSLLENLQGSLPALLTAAKVESPALVSSIEAIVSKLIPEIDAVVAAFAKV